MAVMQIPWDVFACSVSLNVSTLGQPIRTHVLVPKVVSLTSERSLIVRFLLIFVGEERRRSRSWSNIWQNGFLVELLLVQSSNGTTCALVLNISESVAPVQAQAIFMFDRGLRSGVN